MRGCIARSTIFALTLGVLSVATAPADADVSTFPSSIIATPNAPATLTKCALTDAFYKNSKNGTLLVGNRTAHSMATISVTFVAYDSENTRMDQRTVRYSFDQPVASGDTIAQQIGIGFNLSGRDNLLDHVTCRVSGGTFSGNRSWTLGETWKEKLVPLASDAAPQADQPAGPSGNLPPQVVAAMRQQQAPSPKFGLSVTNAWNDTVNGNTFVHVALNVQGAAADAQLSPNMLTLTMRLANGAAKQYTGYSGPAPTYQNAISASNLVDREFRPIVEAAGISDEFRFHDLRHSHATLLLSGGMNPKVVQERLGHESVKTTLDLYGHVLPTAQRDAATLVGNVLFSGKSLTSSLSTVRQRRARTSAEKKKALTA